MGQDAGTTIHIGHFGPDADTSTEGLVARVVAGRGPVTGIQGSEDSSGAAAQRELLGGGGDRGSNRSAGGMSRDMPGEEAGVEVPTSGVGRDLNAIKKAAKGGHNVGGGQAGPGSAEGEQECTQIDPTRQG